MKKKIICLAAAALVGIGAGRVWVLDHENAETSCYLAELSARGLNPDARQLEQFRNEDLPRLIGALSQRESSFELAYVWFCSKLPDPIRNYFPEIMPSEMIRLNAAAAAGQWGSAAAPAVPQLARLLSNELADSNAAVSLGRIGAAAEEAIPALILAVEEEKPFAATALANIGPAARIARPALQTVSENSPACLRKECLLAIHRLDANISARD